MTFEPAAYGPAVAVLVGDAKPNALGPGRPDSSRRGALAALTPESVAAPHALKDRAMALACVAGLWLRYDFLEASHEVSQNIDTPSGSFWHAVLHRREGDFSNAKYWFRRVGDHLVFAPLAAGAHSLARELPAGPATDYLLQGAAWDPFRFVDLCRQAIAGAAPLDRLGARIQQCEWELLFDHCYRGAIGAAGGLKAP